MRIPTRSVNGSRLRKTAAAALLVVGSVVMLVSLLFAGDAAAGSKGNPEGNNGTIKIDGVKLNDGPANEPHVSCRFALEFSGYDKGDLKATVSFELQPPTTRASGSQVLLTDLLAIGEDPAGGATDLDASKLYALDFTGVTPQAKQGYHVKVTVHADGSQGADTKHKVFWVQPCTTPPTTPTTVPETPTTATTATTVPPTTPTTLPETPTTTVAPTTPTTPTTAAVQGATTTNTVPTQVLGEQEVRPGTTLPRTGSTAGRLGLLGGFALALGGLALLLARAGRPDTTG